MIVRSKPLALASPGAGAHTAAAMVSLLDLLLQESEALPLPLLIWPAERVVAGLRVCTQTRRVLLSAVRGGLGVTLQVRCRPRAEQGAADGAGDAGETCGCAELVGFRRFPGARLDLRITPTLSEPVPVAVFSELCRAVRCGDCAGPTSLDLSGCYWSWGDDMAGWGGVCRGPMLVLPVYCMERESEIRASADAPQCVSAHSPCAGQGGGTARCWMSRSAQRW